MNDPFELMGTELSDAVLKRLYDKYIRRSYGALCFSKTWENPVLWSHYAEKHRGMCLGIDVGTGIYVREPFYADRQTKLDASIIVQAMLNNDMTEAAPLMERMLLTKFSGWSYENEMRVLTRLENRTGSYYFYEFSDKLKPSQIILGPLCSVLPSELVKATPSYPGIEVIRTRLSSESFTVVEDEQASKRISPRGAVAPSTSQRRKTKEHGKSGRSRRS